MTIVKHLVFSGGGPIGMVEYGALKYLTERNYIDYKNIESIYSISVGGIIGLIYILNYEWAWMDDFLIKRPWNKLCNITYSSYINILYEKGIINKNVLVSALEPLFLAKNIPLNITLLEFYNLTKIEFNIFACCLSEINQTKFNYINSPNVELLDALYISLTIPILFVPLYINNSFYLDGGIIVGCPINICIAEKKCAHDEIFCFMNDKTRPIDLSNSFYNNYSYNDANPNNISNESNFLEYIFFLIKKLFVKISNVENDIVTYIKNNINTALTYNSIDISYWYQVISCEKERAHLINLGKTQAIKFIDNLEAQGTNDISNQSIDSIESIEAIEAIDSIESRELIQDISSQEIPTTIINSLQEADEPIRIIVNNSNYNLENSNTNENII